MWKPPVLTALSARCIEPQRRGSLGSAGISTLTGQYTRFISAASPQSVCCSYSLQHRNVLLLDGSKQQVCSSVHVCVRVQERKKYHYLVEFVYTTFIHHYTCPLLSICLWLFKSAHTSMSAIDVIIALIC